MTIIGQLQKPIGKIGYKVKDGSATGPDSDTTIGAGASGDIVIAINEPNLYKGAITKISGLPAGVVLAGFEISNTAITLHCFNPTSSDVTVTAGSVSVEYIAIVKPE